MVGGVIWVLRLWAGVKLLCDPFRVGVGVGGDVPLLVSGIVLSVVVGSCSMVLSGWLWCDMGGSADGFGIFVLLDPKYCDLKFHLAWGFLTELIIKFLFLG
eukprot:GHVP01023826.1.p2 GENE.GHVP01023826.1~~GHVP01023826.1.p2  ORF type:complete len:101 (-),score=3.78 GHVP01023826.1:49-351(-)